MKFKKNKLNYLPKLRFKSLLKNLLLFVLPLIFIGYLSVSANWPGSPYGETLGGWLGEVFNVADSGTSQLSINQNLKIGGVKNCSGKLTTDSNGLVACGIDQVNAPDNLGNHSATTNLDMRGNNILNAGNWPTGDNLGNHSATQNLIMNGKNITNAGTISGSSFNPSSLTVGGTSWLNGSTYSPIIYDLNNPSYYINPNSTSNLSDILAQGI